MFSAYVEKEQFAFEPLSWYFIIVFGFTSALVYTISATVIAVSKKG